MDLSTLDKFDSNVMHKVYEMWPQIARESFESDQNQVEFDDINHIVFAGMGGSGAIGDIIASILSKTNIHTSVIKGYLLPKTINSKTLVISTSVSGNTQEILSTLKLSKNAALTCKIN